MGQFDRRPQHHRPKFCKHCKKPVGETVGNSGYCKECIKLAGKEMPKSPVKVDMVRYHDLVFKAICSKLTSEERIELDNMKENLARKGGES